MKFLIPGILITLSILGCTNSSQQQDAAAPQETSAAQGASDIGVGPITEELVLEKDIAADMAKKGNDLFVAKCSACHKMDERYVGPALKGVTQRRSPAWIMNMVMNPQEMTQKDPVAKELFGTYLVQMTFQSVDKDQTRAILEYFRSVDSAVTK